MPFISLRTIREEHTSLSAVLRALAAMQERGPGDDSPAVFFDVMRAMLFYIDEFTERQHHPKETQLLFPRLVLHAPDTAALVARLDAEHASGRIAVRELQHLLLGWELLGEPRRVPFAHALVAYVAFYREHLRLEDTVLLPAAQELLSDEEWRDIDAAFASNRDPLGPQGVPRDPTYDRLFTRIALRVPGLARVV